MHPIALEPSTPWHVASFFQRKSGGRRPNSNANLGDLGVAWIPKPYLHFKASYRFTDKQTDEVRRGVSVSLSFIF